MEIRERVPILCSKIKLELDNISRKFNIRILSEEKQTESSHLGKKRTLHRELAITVCG